jgi:hypothetical protein
MSKVENISDTAIEGNLRSECILLTEVSEENSTMIEKRYLKMSWCQIFQEAKLVEHFVYFGTDF